MKTVEDVLAEIKGFKGNAFEVFIKIAEDFSRNAGKEMLKPVKDRNQSLLTVDWTLNKFKETLLGRYSGPYEFLEVRQFQRLCGLLLENGSIPRTSYDELSSIWK